MGGRRGRQPGEGEEAVGERKPQGLQWEGASVGRGG
jgi:hypothetical protein